MLELPPPKSPIPAPLTFSGLAAPSPASRAAASASRSSSARAAARKRCTARSRSSSIPRRRPSRRRKAPATKSGAAKPAAPPRRNPCYPGGALSCSTERRANYVFGPTTVELLGQLCWLPSPSVVCGYFNLFSVQYGLLKYFSTLVRPTKVLYVSTLFDVSAKKKVTAAGCTCTAGKATAARLLLYICKDGPLSRLTSTADTALQTLPQADKRPTLTTVSVTVQRQCASVQGHSPPGARLRAALVGLVIHPTAPPPTAQTQPRPQP